MLGQEARYLPAHLQVGHVGVEMHSIEAFEIQRDVSIEQVVDPHHAGHLTPRYTTAPASAPIPRTPRNESGA